jgi:hypothetical protein
LGEFPLMRTMPGGRCEPRDVRFGNRKLIGVQNFKPPLHWTGKIVVAA